MRRIGELRHRLRFVKEAPMVLITNRRDRSAARFCGTVRSAIGSKVLVFATMKTPRRVQNER